MASATTKSTGGRAAAGAKRPTTGRSPSTRTIKAVEEQDRPQSATRPRSTRSVRTVTPPGQADPAAARRRRVVALGTVAGALTITAALLLVLRPAPLVPGSARTLMAVDTPAQVDSLFDTEIPVSASRWRYLYIHHAGTDDVDPDGLDHFVVGNGRSLGDGEVRIGQRWSRQQPAGKTKGLDRVDPDCVSVCVVGDLDRGVPSPRQMDQLGRLVRALQDRLQVPGDRVMVVEAPGLPAGCGKYFPRDAFRAGLIQ